MFGKAIDFDGGEYGQAVLSRWPIKHSVVHRLPNEQQSNGSMREQRIVLEATIPSQLGTIRFFSTHLDHSKEDLRHEQARAVDGLLDTVSLEESKAIATVLAGDLNATPKSRTLTSFEQRWQIDPQSPSELIATYPSESPKTRIDYVLVDRAGRLVVESIEVLPEPVASDHRPVLGTLAPRPAKP